MRMRLPWPQQEAQPALLALEPELVAVLGQLQLRQPHSRNVLRMQRNTISWTWS